jgi:hypothetical protein
VIYKNINKLQKIINKLQKYIKRYHFVYKDS